MANNPIKNHNFFFPKIVLCHRLSVRLTLEGTSNEIRIMAHNLWNIKRVSSSSTELASSVLVINTFSKNSSSSIGWIYCDPQFMIILKVFRRFWNPKLGNSSRRRSGSRQLVLVWLFNLKSLKHLWPVESKLDSVTTDRPKALDDLLAKLNCSSLPFRTFQVFSFWSNKFMDRQIRNQ